MTYISLVVKFIASTVIAISVASTTAPLKGPEVVTEQPAVIAAQVTPPVAVVRQSDGKDCVEFTSIIEKYDWPTETAMQVCKEESQGNPSNIGDKDTDYVSCGLMQIRALPGRLSCEELKDPEVNIAFAYQLWQEQGWAPWSVCQTKVDCDLGIVKIK